MLYVAIGILGATAMPHNLYLHSALVTSRRPDRTQTGIRQALRYSRFDVVGALGFAIFVDAAILILAAAAFHGRGLSDLGIRISSSHRRSAPAWPAHISPLPLLASGQNSSIMGTLTGQIVLAGFADLRVAPWVRQLGSRVLAMLPAIVAISIWGEDSVTYLPIFSQVLLSLQLPFADYPLVRLTGDTSWMGPFANRRSTAIAAWGLTIGLIALNGYLLLVLML